LALFSIFRGWLKRQADMRALEALGPEGRREIAQDFSLSESTLSGLAARGPSAADQLPKILRSASLDPAELSCSHPEVMRDMAVVCSQCDESSRCESDLTLRISAATYDEYCPNAQTIKALRQEEMNR
jgi:hypothetical protein